MEKPYAVVHFMEQNSYSEIPSNWLLDTDESTGVTECKWPPPFIKNLNFQFKNRITPSDEWPIYKVKLMQYCDTLNQARRAAEDSDYSASEGPQGKGHRSKFLSATAAAAAATSKYPSISDDISSDDENDNGKKPAAEMPKIDKIVQKKTPIIPPTTHFYKSDKERPNNNDQSLEVQNSKNIVKNNGLSDLGGDKNNNLHRNQSTKNDEFWKDSTLINYNGTSVISEQDGNIIDGDDDGRFHTINDKLDSCLRLLGILMVDMKDLKQRIVANNDANNGEVMTEIESKVKNDLPLNSREEVSAFNAKLLESKDYHREFVRVLKQVGGANGKEYTERALNTIFSISFAADNSWEGKKTKYKLNDLKLIETCEEVILKKFPLWDRAEFSKTGTNWFRLGNQRAGLQKGQVQKQMNHGNKRNKDATE